MDRAISVDMDIFSLDNVRLAVIVEYEGGMQIRVFLCQCLNEADDPMLDILSISFAIRMIHTKYEHDLLLAAGFPYDKMPPISLLSFRVVGRKSGCSRESIDLLEDPIHFFIGKHAVRTIDNPIEFALLMESESIFVMYLFSRGNVFPPREFELVAVSMDFRRGDDRMEDSILNEWSDVIEGFPHLFFLDEQLIPVTDWEPFAPAVDLKMLREILLERRPDNLIKELSFAVILPVAQDPQIHPASGDRPSGYDDLLPIRSQSQAFSSEYELFDEHILKHGSFFHGIFHYG